MWLNAHIVRRSAILVVVWSIARAIGVLEEVDVLLKRRSEEDVVLGHDGVIVGLDCCIDCQCESTEPRRRG